MSTAATGIRSDDPTPVRSASGIMENTRVAVVMRIGRRRVAPARTSASSRATPRSMSWRAKSTSRMAFFATSPISMIMAMSENMFRVWPVSHSPKNAPTVAMGREHSTTNGVTKDSYSAAISMYTRTIESANACVSGANAAVCCAIWPPSDHE